MKKQMIISVMSKDRPGIIASITGAIYKLEGDVSDLNQSVLCNYLNMILSVSFNENVNKEDLIAEISHIKTECKFEVSIKEIDQGGEKIPPPEETYIMTVHGPNRTGLVYGISQFCADHTINILDLATTLKGNRFSMVLQLDLQNCPSPIETVQSALEDYSEQSGQTITMQHNDIFQVTNEVTLH
ncbi:MAG: hypothetical protein JRJ68_04160 [Deltaproteobacteria bacterium]|nr:hypothetical protein [Deltaproteobacteria bacterium]